MLAINAQANPSHQMQNRSHGFGHDRMNNSWHYDRHNRISDQNGRNGQQHPDLSRQICQVRLHNGLMTGNTRNRAKKFPKWD